MIEGKPKIAIIGAGFVGASAAFAMSLNQLASEVVLIDANHQKAVGEAMDISHGLSFLGQMSIYAGGYSDCADCDIIIITAGISRKSGESRLDLTKKNVAIAKDIATNIMKYYTRGVILVVSNPVDILTYVIQKTTGLPNGRVLGTGTSLDSSRFRFLLSNKLKVDVRNVHGYIIGEHGDSQLPVWSATHIAGKNIEEYCKTPESGFTEEDKIQIANEVKAAGAEIIKNKGATYYAIAVTINTLVESLLKNQNTIRTVSSVINGAYGINDVALSLPSMINYNGVYDYLHLNLNAYELEALQKSAEHLKLMLKEI